MTRIESTSSTSAQIWAPPRPRGFRLSLALALMVGCLAGAGWTWAAPTRAESGAHPAPAGVPTPVLPPIRLELPREYREWLHRPITFDHMYRKDAAAVR